VPVEPVVSDPDEYRDHGISADAGEQYFAQLGGGDPYATGLPYPVFLALLETYPTELGADLEAFAEKFGFLRDPALTNGLPIGMHLTRDPITRVPFVMNNCHLCHAERLRLPDGDRFVSGLGSSRVRVHAYDAALTRIDKIPASPPRSFCRSRRRRHAITGLRGHQRCRLRSSARQSAS
jgi:hypothetical protein